MAGSSFTVVDVWDAHRYSIARQTRNLLASVIARLHLLNDDGEMPDYVGGAVDAAVSLIVDSGVTGTQHPGYDEVTQSLLECAFIYDTNFMIRLLKRGVLK